MGTLWSWSALQNVPPTISRPQMDRIFKLPAHLPANRFRPLAVKDSRDIRPQGSEIDGRRLRSTWLRFVVDVVQVVAQAPL